MNYRCKVGFHTVFLLILSLLETESYKRCSHHLERCILFDSCSTLNTNQKVSVEKICGFVGKVPKICCPIITPESRINRVEEIKEPSKPNSIDCGLLDSFQNDSADFPWLALIIYRDISNQKHYDCSGTLISQQYVLTAAHCVAKNHLFTVDNWTPKGVRLGNAQSGIEEECDADGKCIDDRFQEILIDKIISREDFFPAQRYNDLALLKLENLVKINTLVRPICLLFDKNLRGKHQIDGEKFIVPSWNQTESMPTYLNGVTRSECEGSYSSSKQKILNFHICAKRESGIDSCEGGPLMVLRNDESGRQNIYLVGELSFGPNNCETSDMPAVYTRVATYISWIESILLEHELKLK